MAIELQTNISLETTPVDPQHLVNMKWVLDFFTGRVKAPVRLVATTDQDGTYAAMVLTLTASGPTVIDGETLADGDRVLLAGQTTGTENGIYVVTHAGNGGGTATILTRAADFDDSSEIESGVTIAVQEGDDFADTTWKLATTGTIVLGTTALEFIQVVPATSTAKYAETITGDSVADEFTITHGLGTSDIQVQVWNNVTKAMVLTDITIVDNNEITVSFAEAPTPAQVYRIVCIG